MARKREACKPTCDREEKTNRTRLRYNSTDVVTAAYGVKGGGGRRNAKNGAATLWVRCGSCGCVAPQWRSSSLLSDLIYSTGVKEETRARHAEGDPGHK